LPSTHASGAACARVSPWRQASARRQFA
jgi:hypothetical protein